MLEVKSDTGDGAVSQFRVREWYVVTPTTPKNEVLQLKIRLNNSY